MRPRSEPRYPAIHPVQFQYVNAEGGLVNKTVYTTNISRRGMRLYGVDSVDRSGEVVHIGTTSEGSRYRVAWMGGPGSSLHGFVGLQCLEVEDPVFSRGLAEKDDDEQFRPENWVRPEGCRRKDSRFCVVGGANVRTEGTDADHWTKLHDISTGGCYVWTASPLHLHEPVQVTAYIGDQHIDATGVVAKADPAVGMAIRFTGMNLINRQCLANLIENLTKSVPASGHVPASA